MQRYVVVLRRNRERFGRREPRREIRVGRHGARFLLGTQRLDPALSHRPTRAVGDGRHKEIRLRVGDVAIHRGHRVIAEKCRERIKILGAHRIKFVIVTRCTARRETEPDSGHRLDAVFCVDRLVFGGDRAALTRRRQATVETGRHLLLQRRIRQEIAGHLFNGELIEGQILPKRPDDPVAKRPNRTVVVDVDTVRIGVADRVEPLPRELLGRRVRREEPIDSTVVSRGRGIAHKRREVLRRRRQAREIERHAPQQTRRLLRATRLETGRCEGLRDEGVDGIARPRLRGAGHRNSRPHGCEQRPVLLIGCPLGDPPLEQGLFLGLERFVRVRGRHDLLRVGGKNTLHERTGVGFSRHNRRGVFTALGRCKLCAIQAQLGFASRRIGSVTRETILREDGLNLRVILDRRGRCGCRRVNR